MATTAFCCPHCSAPLRIRDRALLGREVGCPDCGKPILIKSDGPHGFAGVAVTEPTSEETAGRPVRHMWRAVVTSPAVLGWMVAVGGAVGAWTLIDWSGEDEPPGHHAEAAASRPVDATEQPLIPPLGNKVGRSEPDGEEKSHDVSEPELAQAATDSSNVDPRPATSSAVDTAPAAAASVSDSASVPQAADRVQIPIEAPLPVRAIAARDEALTSGEFGDSAALPPTADADLGPEPEDVPEPVNVEAALGQRIAGYRTVRPVVLRVLLGELEELVGVPIQPQGGNELDGALEQEVSVRLEATTVGEILSAVLQQAGLSYAQVEGGIRIRTAAEAGKGTER